MQGQMIVGICKGDWFEHYSSGEIIEIISFDMVNDTAMVRVVRPHVGPSYILTGHSILRDYRLHTTAKPGSLSLKAALIKPFPQVGDIWAENSYGDEYIVVFVNSVKGEVVTRCAHDNSAPSVTSSVADLHKYCDLRYPVGASAGLASLSAMLPPLPPGKANEFFGVTMKNILPNKCTCGIDSIGGGKHSDWCDKHEKEERS